MTLRSRVISLIEVGQTPLARCLQDGFKSFEGTWQKDAWLQMRVVNLGLIVSFMGSGKSLLLCGLAWDYVMGHSPLSPIVDGVSVGRAIITVPQKMNSWSFMLEYCRLPNGELMEWRAARFLCDTDDERVSESTIQTILAFIRNPPSPVPGPERILICSQQAMVIVHKILMKEWREKKLTGTPYKHIALIIDEGHKVKNEKVTGDVTLEDLAEWQLDKFQNKLGQVEEHYIQHQSDVGPLWLTTATPMRGDYHTIIPENHRSKFTFHENPASEYLATIEHLKQVTTRFVVGNAEEIVQHLLAEAAGDKGVGPTLWYQPASSNKMLLPNGSKTGKIPLLQRWKRIAESLGLRTLDLVDVKDREGKLLELRKAIKSGAPLPDVIFFQDLGREGFDCPPAWRVVVIGARTSFPLLVQIFGRPLRSFEGKSTAEFILVLPFEGTWEDDEGDHIGTYLNAILSLLAIEWKVGPLYRHRGVVLKPNRDLTDLFLDDRLIEAMGKGKEAELEAVENICVEMGITGEEKDRVFALLSNALKAAIAGAKDIPSDVIMEMGVVGFLRIYLSSFGVGLEKQDLRNFKARYFGSRRLDDGLLRRNVRLFVRENKRRPLRSDGKLPNYTLNPDLNWDAVADAVTTGSRGLSIYGSFDAFVGEACGKPWSVEFLEDVDTENRGLFETKTMAVHVREHRKEQPYATKYEAIRRCYDLPGSGERFIKHPSVTPELAAALGTKDLTKVAKKRQRETSAFLKALLQSLDAGDRPSPREAAERFRIALGVVASGPVMGDTT